MTYTVEYQEGIRKYYTKAVFQFTKDFSISIQGLPITLPLMIDISNHMDQGNAIRYKIESIPIRLPDEYFITGNYVYVMILSETPILVVIPVIPRSLPVNAPQAAKVPHYNYQEDDENLVIEESENDLLNGGDDTYG